MKFLQKRPREEGFKVQTSLLNLTLKIYSMLLGVNTNPSMTSGPTFRRFCVDWLPDEATRVLPYDFLVMYVRSMLMFNDQVTRAVTLGTYVNLYNCHYYAPA